MLKSIPLPAVLIDVETTGGITYGRITEIGIVEIDSDEIREWSSFVNPGVEIPPDIQKITGITNTMVASAPRFEDIADEVYTRIKDKLFIAHNVGFDYGFLRKELGLAGIAYKAPLMCSVQLSRALYTDAVSHSLENIIKRHNISVRYRHRAMDDARATYQFLQLAEKEHGVEKFRAAFHQQFQYGDLPLNIDPEVISTIPRQPGVFYIWGDNKTLLYIGKGNNVRAEVFALFLSGDKTPLEIKLCQQTRAITWDTAAGELSAITLHANKVNSLAPAYNKRHQVTESLFSIFLEENAQGWLLPVIVNAQEIVLSHKRLYGQFSSEKQAMKEIKRICTNNDLCFYADRKQSSLDGICNNPACKGLCAGRENFLKHNIKMLKVFDSLALKKWPYNHVVMLSEVNNETRQTQRFLLHNWCLLATDTEGDANVLENTGIFDIHLAKNNLPGIFIHHYTPILDRNIYRYLCKVIFGKSASAHIREIPLRILSR